jgi:hypothetical protein
VHGMRPEARSPTAPAATGKPHACGQNGPARIGTVVGRPAQGTLSGLLLSPQVVVIRFLAHHSYSFPSGEGKIQRVQLAQAEDAARSNQIG